MSSTIVSSMTKKESEWAAFLASLEPWELHCLVKDATELICHDLFVADEITLKEIRSQIALDLDDVRHVDA